MYLYSVFRVQKVVDTHGIIIRPSFIFYALLVVFVPHLWFSPLIYFFSRLYNGIRSTLMQVVAFHFWFAKKLRCFNSANGFTNFLFTNSLLSLLIVVRFRTKTSRFCEFVKSCHDRVHIFWEGHKILRNLTQLFDWKYIGQVIGGDFSKFCGLLRIYELYNYLFQHLNKIQKFIGNQYFSGI